MTMTQMHDATHSTRVKPIQPPAVYSDSLLGSIPLELVGGATAATLP